MRFTRKALGIPYAVFLLLFVVAPLLVLFFYAFTNSSGQFTLQNLTGFFTDPNTLGTLCYSVAIAFVTTVVCLLLAYPTAYFLATSGLKMKDVRAILEEISDTDRRIKMGEVTDRIGLETLLVKIST